MNTDLTEPDLEALIRTTLTEHAEDAPTAGRVIAHALRPGSARRRPTRRAWIRGAAAAGLVGALVAAAVVLAPRILPTESESVPAMTFAYDGLPRSADAYRLVLDAPGWEIPEFDGSVTADGRGGGIIYEKSSATGKHKPRIGVSWSDDVTYEESLRHGDVFNMVDGDGNPDGVTELPIEVLGQQATYWSHVGGKDVGDRDPETGEPVLTEDAFRVTLPPRHGHYNGIEARGITKAEFEQLLTQVRWADESAFDAALPGRYISTQERPAAIEELLRGTPLPEAYAERLTSSQPNRHHLALDLANGAVCAWWDEWNAAREASDGERQARVKEVLGKAGSWPIQKELAGSDAAHRLPEALRVLEKPSTSEDTSTGPELYGCV